VVFFKDIFYAPYLIDLTERDDLLPPAPTSQNRDVGHPAPGVDFAIGSVEACDVVEA